MTTASVNDAGREAYIGVTDQHGHAQILRYPMSDDQFAEHRTQPDFYFGTVLPVSRNITGLFEQFEWLMEVNEGLSRQTLLERLHTLSDINALARMSDTDLLAEYCESLAGAFAAAGFITPEVGSE